MVTCYITTTDQLHLPEQWLANQGLGLGSVFVKKILLEQKKSTYLHVIYGGFPAVTADLSSCHKDSMIYKA